MDAWVFYTQLDSVLFPCIKLALPEYIPHIVKCYIGTVKVMPTISLWEQTNKYLLQKVAVCMELRPGHGSFIVQPCNIPPHNICVCEQGREGGQEVIISLTEKI